MSFTLHFDFHLIAYLYQNEVYASYLKLNHSLLQKIVFASDQSISFIYTKNFKYIMTVTSRCFIFGQ